MSSQNQDNVPEQQISYRSDQLLYCMIHHYSERHQRQIHHINELNNTVTLQRSMLANYLGQVAFFEEDVPNEVLYPECGCNGNQNTNEQICMNPLDKVFNVPGYLEKQILDLTSQKLLTTYFKLKTDITDNGVDGQAPNTIPNS